MSEKPDKEYGGLAERLYVGDGGTAFPNHPFQDVRDFQVQIGSAGMSLRAYISTRCLASLLTNQAHMDETKKHVQPHNLEKQLARHSVCFADALIAELQKEGKP